MLSCAGESVYSSLHGSSVDVNVRLDRSSFKLENTYIRLSTQRYSNIMLIYVVQIREGGLMMCIDLTVNHINKGAMWKIKFSVFRFFCIQVPTCGTLVTLRTSGRNHVIAAHELFSSTYTHM